MSSGELSIPGMNRQVSKYEADFTKLARANDYLPRLQLFGSNSNDVKARRIPMAHFGIVTSKESPISDLGEEIDVIPLAWRPKALRMGDQVIACYNPALPEFKRIEEESEIKDSGCVYGPEFLVWVPKDACFTALHMNSKTNRKTAPQLKALLDKMMAANLKGKFIETKKHSWHGIDVFACTTQVAPLPDGEKANAEITKFLNPPESQLETDVDTSDRAR